MVKALVTGGAGFIGSHLVDKLLDAGHAVCVLDALTYAGRKSNLDRASDHKHFQFVEGNVCSAQDVRNILADFQPQALFHLAAETHVDRSIDASAVFVQTNIVGTHVLLEEARRFLHGRSTADNTAFRFVHVSTDEVFGSMAPGEKASETSPYKPRSPYAASKASADHLVRSYMTTYDFPALIVHPSNNYGPRQFPEKLIPVVLLNALAGKPIPVYGQGTNEREWLYVKDCAAGMVEVFKKGKIGASYCLGTGCGVQNIDLVRHICRVLDKVHPLEGRSYRDLVTFVEDRPGHDQRYALDTHKMKTEHNWVPKVRWQSGVEETVTWYLKHPEALKASAPYKRLGVGK